MNSATLAAPPLTVGSQPADRASTQSKSAAESPGTSFGVWSAFGLAGATLTACGGGTAEGPSPLANMPFAAAQASTTLIANAAPRKAVLQQQTISADGLMDWAQNTLPTYFPGPQSTVTASTDGISYVYRSYSLINGTTNIIAVTSDAKVYLYGAVTGNVLTQFGMLQDYACSVAPNSCPGTGINQAPANATEAARFLAQASLGATKADINGLLTGTYAAWIDAQVALPQSLSHYDWLVTKGYNDAIYINGENGLNNTIWRKLIGGKDLLRQRVTLALSEICVASVSGVAISWRQFALANYLDILENNAFGNYRTLLDQISLSTAMSVYLTYRGNTKANATTGSQPDENYAREVMQLFSIGLLNLNDDGTPTLTDGDTTESYTQSDVSGLARVFTGWDFNNSGFTSPFPPDVQKRPLTQVASRYETGAKSFLGVTIPAGTSALAGLKIALDTLFNHPNLPPFISRQLIQRLITSNPNPAYVQRVSSVFKDNGSGVRGDLKAVVTAILLDTEARDMSRVNDVTFGKVREPMVRFLNWARGFEATSPSDVWNVGDLSDAATKLGQSPMRSSSVFNFFRPGYVQPGSELAARGLAAPELQITDESSVSGYINFMQRVISGSGIADVKGNYTAWTPLATNSANLLAEINLVLAANQVPASTLATLKTALDTINVTTDAGKLNRVYAAITLMMACPAYIAQK